MKPANQSTVQRWFFSAPDYQDAVKVTDENGMITWTNLPDENASFSVNASGYYTKDSAMTVQNGPNEVTVTLEADPLGLLPAAACAAGEIPPHDRGCAGPDFPGLGATFQGDSNRVSRVSKWSRKSISPGNYVLKVSSMAEGHAQIGVV